MDGEQLTYTATAGTLLMGVDNSDAVASMFYIAYRKDGEDAPTRPITFVFNGGPGSSAAWLHVGALGPRRLLLHDEGGVPEPPARMVDNAETWLRFTDLVFVDPVGTGFSRAVSKEAEGSSDGKAFWSIRGDLRALGTFIRLYLNRNERWASPKYLAGESYGGFRAAALAELLPVKGGVELSGVVLISPVIEYTLNLGSDYLNIMPWVTFVPSFAATAYYHGKYRGPGDDLKSVTEQAEAFSLGKLLVALASGGSQRSAEVSEILDRLSAMTGLDIVDVHRHRGRIASDVFAKRLLQDRGHVVGIYDGSISTPDPDPFSAAYPERDPSFDSLIGPGTRRTELQNRPALRIDEPRCGARLELDRSRSWRSSGCRSATARCAIPEPEAQGAARARLLRSRHALFRVEVCGRAAGIRRRHLSQPSAIRVSRRPHVLYAYRCSPAVLSRCKGAL
jgi:carboxypeptidase C (cathepsin A)